MLFFFLFFVQNLLNNSFFGLFFAMLSDFWHNKLGIRPNIILCDFIGTFNAIFNHVIVYFLLFLLFIYTIFTIHVVFRALTVVEDGVRVYYDFVGDGRRATGVGGLSVQVARGIYI